MIKTTTRRIALTRKKAHCPRCGELSKRHSTCHRRLREIGITGPTVVEVTYSKHYCGRCRKHFTIGMDHLAPASGRFTHRVRRVAVEMVARQGMTLSGASWRMRQRYFVNVPPTTIHDWVVEAMVA